MAIEDDIVALSGEVTSAVGELRTARDAANAANVASTSNAAAAATDRAAAVAAKTDAEQIAANLGDLGTALAAATADADRAELAATAAQSVVDQDLSALALDHGITDARATCVYRIADDPDGGEAVRNAKNTSWYKGFGPMPEVVGVVASTSSGVILFDMSSGAEWMPFSPGGSGSWDTFNMQDLSMTVTSASMSGGTLVIVSSENSRRFTFVDFVEGTAYRAFFDPSTSRVYSGSIAERNDGLGYTRQSTRFAGMLPSGVNDVAVFRYPSAPVDPVTGVQVPTIALAQETGLCVLNSPHAGFSGVVTVVAGDGNNAYSGVSFLPDGKLQATHTNTGSVLVGECPAGNQTPAEAKGADWVQSRYHSLSPINAPTLRTGATKIDGQAAASASVAHRIKHADTGQFVTSVTPDNVESHFIGLASNTLSSTETAALPAGSTVPDLSSNNFYGSIIGGAVTRAPAVTGGDLVMYSGFFDNNSYIQFPHNAQLAQASAVTYSVFYRTPERGDYSAIFAVQSASGFGGYGDAMALFAMVAGSSTLVAVPGYGDVFFDSIFDELVHLVVTIEGQAMKVFVNGEVAGSATLSAAYDTSSAVNMQTNLGALRNDGNIQNRLRDGEVGLLSAYSRALSESEIKLLHRVQKAQLTSSCKLIGSTVRGIAEDRDAGLIHVLTEAGHNVFEADSMTRLDYTAGDWSTISAHGGVVVKG